MGTGILTSVFNPDILVAPVLLVAVDLLVNRSVLSALVVVFERRGEFETIKIIQENIGARKQEYK